MQQTEKYKLNLIESGDPFLPGALNENTEKVEEELDALDQRVTMLEAKYIIFGTYTGNGQKGQLIELGFTPRIVLIHDVMIQYYTALATADQPSWYASRDIVMEIVENGFIAYNGSNARELNTNSRLYNYVAFA